jgi:hypothetical protein
VTQPKTSTEQETLAHLQLWHTLMPPYYAPPEEVHTCLHDDAATARDRDHDVRNLTVWGRP